jgi:hypothetical protein
VKSLKPLLLLGALVGFFGGVVLGLINQSDWPSILWRSSAASLVFGVLLRWWGQRWTECLRLAHQERYVAMMAQRQDRHDTKASRANAT